jgi:hypothetical protein
MLIDQINPHLPKDNEEVSTHVKLLQAMSDATTVVDPVDGHEDRDQGHEPDHQKSPHWDSASRITPLEKCGRENGRDNCDLCDIICDRDARGWIKKRRRE